MQLRRLALAAVISIAAAPALKTQTSTHSPPRRVVSAVTTTTTTAPPVNTASASSAPAVAASVSAPDGPWLAVAECEEGGRNDPTFGYLGIYEETWRAYGGTEFAPLPGEASWDEQVTVAYRIESPPWSDTPAGGCHGW